MKTRKPSRVMQAWIDAQQRLHLSHAEAQMARKLSLNPARLGKLDNHDQEPWKMPLREYIQHLHLERFGARVEHTCQSFGAAGTLGRSRWVRLPIVAHATMNAATGSS